MDGRHRHNKQKKPDTKAYTLTDSLYMKFRITRQLGSNILFSTLVMAPQIYNV